MNLFIHGKENYQTKGADSIRNLKLRTKDDALRHFDIAVTNTPFSLDQLGTEAAETEKFGRSPVASRPRTNGDYVFTGKCSWQFARITTPNQPPANPVRFILSSSGRRPESGRCLEPLRRSRGSRHLHYIRWRKALQARAKCLNALSW